MTSPHVRRPGAETPEVRTRRWTAFCFAGTGASALLGLLLWILGLWRLGTFGETYVPMAPSTSLVLLALALPALLRALRPTSRAWSALAVVASAVVTLGGAVFLFEGGAGLPSLKGLLDVGAGQQVGQIPVGRMSPLTALVLTACAVVLLLEATLSRRRAARKATALGSLGILLVGITIAAGYLLQSPVFYGTRTIPVAALTAFALVLFGFGLLFGSGPDVWPVDLFFAHQGNPRSPARLTGGYVAAFVIFAAGLVALALLFLSRQEAEARRAALDTLQSVAELKVRQIETWRNERLGDGSTLLADPVTARRVRDFIRGERLAEEARALRAWFDALIKTYQYESVTVVDQDGQVVFSLGPGAERVGPAGQEAVSAAWAADRPVLSDIHQTGAVPHPHLDLAVPVPAEAPGGRSAGALLLRLNPETYLYPLIERWPTPSLTAESLLVRVETDRVRFLNNLNHGKVAALSLILPMAEEDLPAARLMRGQAALGEGKDYRGVEVLYAGLPLKGFGWGLVAKVDREEVAAPLRAIAWRVGAVTLFLLVVGGYALFAAWRRGEAERLRTKAESDREREALVRHYDFLSKYANDMILMAGEDGGLLEANDRALSFYGYTREAMLALRISDLRAPEAKDDLFGRLAQTLQAGGVVYETVHARKDGTVFPVEVSARHIEVEGRKFFHAVVRDITERKHAEASLQISETKFRAVFENNASAISLINPDTTIAEVNDAYCAVSGYSRDEAVGMSWTCQIVPEDLERLMDYNRRRLQGDPTVPRQYEFGFLTKEGERREGLISLSLVPGIGKIAASFADITERKRAEARNRWLADLVESSEDAIIGKDLDGTITSWNRGALALYGYSEAEVLGRSVSLLFPQEAKEELARVLAAIRAGERLPHHETARLRKDGSPVYVSLSVSPVFDADGKVVGASTVARDISDRRRADDIRAARMRLMEFAQAHPFKEVLQRALDEAEGLTGSRIGFFHFVEPDQENLSLQVWSTNTLQNMCTAEGAGRHYPVSEAGVWVDCLREARPVIHNDYASLPNRKGMPPGHAPVVRELVIPVVRGGLVRAIMGVGNKAGDYRDLDVEAVSSLADMAWDFAEVKRVEAALVESEERLRRAVTEAPFPIMVHAEDGAVVFTSRSWNEITGYAPEEIPTIAAWTERAYGKRKELVMEDIERLYGLTKKVDEGEYEIATAAGSRRVWQFSSAPIGRLPDGRRMVISMAVDVTERKAAEAGLRESEDRFKYVFENSIIGKSITAPDGRVHVNRAFAAMLGYTLEELEDADWKSLTHPEDVEESARYIAELLSGERTSARFVKRYLRKDGSIVWADIGTTLRRDEAGAPLYLMTAVMDITERVQAEERARRFAQIFEDSLNEIYLFDATTLKFIQVNGSAQRNLGYTMEELRGLTPLDIKPDFTSEAFSETIAPLRDGREKRLVFQTRHERKDGSLYPVEVHLQLMSFGDLPLFVAIINDITERLRAEEALRASEAREKTRAEELAALLDAVPAAVWITEEPEALHMRSNRVGAEWTLTPEEANVSKSAPEGERPETFKACRHGEEIPPEDLPVQRAARGEAVRDYEFDLVYPEGGVRHLLGNATPLTDASGRPRGAVSAFVDITERMRAEAEILLSERRLREAQRLAALGNWELDLVSGQLTWSEEIYRIFGVDPETFGASYEAFLETIHPEDREMVSQAYERSLEQRLPYDIVHRLRLVDGQIKWVHERCETEYDEAGRALRSVGTVQDITGRMRAEAELEALNRRLQALASSIQQLAEERTEQGVLDVIRRTARNIVGADGICLVLREGDECYYAEEDAVAPLWKGQRFPMSACVSGWCMLNAQATAIENIFTDPRVPVDAYRGTFVRSLAMVPIDMARPVGVIGAYWRETHRARAAEMRLMQALADATSTALENVRTLENLERLVQERTAELSAANAELENFAHSVSHDLRAPLRGIDGWSHALLEDYGGLLDDGGRSFLNRIRGESQLMSELIDALLELSKVTRHPMEREPVDLGAMARDIEAELRAADPARKVELVVAPGLEAMGDSRLLRVALQNLLTNAWKFTSKRPDASVEIGVLDGEGPDVFFVSDNGAGFNMAYADKLFQPFQRLHGRDEYPGTGIGLATVERVVRRHGGTVWAEGEEGKGATFYFTLEPEPSAPEKGGS